MESSEIPIYAHANNCLFPFSPLRVLTMACEHQLLAGCGGGPVILGCSSNDLYNLQ